MIIDAPAGLGKQFYDRYYRNRRTRVVTPGEMTRRAELIVAFVRHVELPVRRILDAGCGLGLMRAPLLHGLPAARYTGLETSGYLCERYGWELGSIADWRPRRPFDLVVCYDVLQYLDTREAAAAMRALGRLCTGVLHFSALTLEDWREHCDRRRTDRAVHLRTADWYRARLRTDFVNAGSGMFVRRDAGLHLWTLDRLPSAPARRKSGPGSRNRVPKR
jgi:SAM-dependent methyltransferase